MNRLNLFAALAVGLIGTSSGGGAFAPDDFAVGNNFDHIAHRRYAKKINRTARHHDIGNTEKNVSVLQ